MAADRTHKSNAANPCKFCAIVEGTEPAFAVYEDDVAFGFLDYRPLALGHVLLVPRVHYATLADIPEDAFGPLAVRAKRVSAAVIKAMQAEGSFLALNNIVSQSVPHLHFHIVPRRQKDGVFTAGYVWKRVNYESDEQRADVARRIQEAMG